MTGHECVYNLDGFEADQLHLKRVGSFTVANLDWADRESREQRMCKYFLVSVFFLWSLGPMRGQNAPPPQTDPAYQQQVKAGQSAVAAGDYKAALDIFKKLNKLHDNSCAACYVGMAAAYMRMAQFDNAIASSERALAFADNNPMKATAHSFKARRF